MNMHLDLTLSFSEKHQLGMQNFLVVETFKILPSGFFEIKLCIIYNHHTVQDI